VTPERELVAAFEAAPRTGFLPADQRRFAHLDNPLPIGWGQTNSQPTTVRVMLRLLDVHPGHSALDLGCGSAWSTALLARLVGPTGSVVGVEVVPQLVDFGRANLEAAALPQARIEPAEPGVLGRPDDAPYDRVLVSAEAGRMPTALIDQLALEGVMVVPVAGWMYEVRRTDAEPDVVRHGRFSFVPLIGG
jgi:protein-L-isoaspartate(D-aspartate) O-methyltransferase